MSTIELLLTLYFIIGTMIYVLELWRLWRMVGKKHPTVLITAYMLYLLCWWYFVWSYFVEREKRAKDEGK